MLNDTEIQAIIERVKGRVAAAAHAARSGPALEAAAELDMYRADLGDGIRESVDAAVSAARAAFVSYRDMGLEARKTIVDSMRAAMLREGELRRPSRLRRSMICRCGLDSAPWVGEPRSSASVCRPRGSRKSGPALPAGTAPVRT